MSSVTAWTGRMTAHIVWDWAADCTRLVVLWWQRSCLQTAACPTDKCSSVGRMQLSDMGVGDEQTVVGQVTWGFARQGPVDDSRNLKQWTRSAATQEASAASGAQARYDHIARCPSRAWRQRSELPACSTSVRPWCHSTVRYSSPGDW